MSKIDNAIAVLNYEIKRRQRRVDEMSRKVEPTENEKVFIGRELELIKNVNVLIAETKSKVAELFGKLPPQASELEEMVLGAMMLSNQSGIDKVPFLLPNHFYFDKNQRVFAAIQALQATGHPIDMATVVIQLRRMGALEIVGGAVYIANMTSRVSSAGNIEYHARVLVEMAIKRALILISGQLLNDGYDDTKDCFEMLDYLDEERKKIQAWIK